MKAPALRARVKRLGELIDELRREAESVLAGRGVLTLAEWDAYVRALNGARWQLTDARGVLSQAARRVTTTIAEPGR
jgi:hypothetical protein